MKSFIGILWLITVAALLFGICAASAADVGYAGALRTAREWFASTGQDPDSYTMRVDEDLCERVSGRCYQVLAWLKGHRIRWGHKGEGPLIFLVDPRTGQLDD